jgi:3',5'-cyclic AMP phosphodiesterase CpdA
MRYEYDEDGNQVYIKEIIPELLKRNKQELMVHYYNTQVKHIDIVLEGHKHSIEEELKLNNDAAFYSEKVQNIINEFPEYFI